MTSECHHNSSVGLSESGKIFYPEQRDLKGEQVRCTDDCGRVFESYEDLYRDAMGVPNPESLTCLNHHEEDCSGRVELRTPLSGSGKSFPRCDAHWSKRLAMQERNNRNYPDSPIAPAWFDPSNAGERWDDEY
jgi:hypothetical protein